MNTINLTASKHATICF